MNDAVLHFVAHWLPPSEGFVHDLVRSLDRPAVVVASRPLENAERFPVDDVRTLAPLLGVVPGPFQRKAVTARLLALAARREIGLVHAHHGYDCDRVLGLVNRRRLPFVLSLHGDDLTGFMDRAPGYYAPVRPFVDAVVVPSAFLAGYAVQAGFDEATIRVLPSGVDVEYFSPSPLPDGPPEVLFVGRFVEKKGLDVLARAWPVVQDKVAGARLRLLGYGPLEPLARSIAGDVEVSLRPDRAEVRDAMRRARVVVSPSRTAGHDDMVESLLVVNVEAQASGRPVVTTDHGGIPEHVQAGTTALVVPEGDADALAEALVAVLVDDALAARLGSAGPDWARRYDLRASAARMGALYDELAGTPR